MYRKTAYIIARIVALFFIVILGALFAIQSPNIQTKISKIALEKIAKELNGNISCENISIMPSGAVLLENILILDSEAYSDTLHNFSKVDTLASIARISVSFSPLSLLSKEFGIRLNRITIDDAVFNLVSEPGDETKRVISNIERIFRLPKGPEERGEPGPSVLYANKVNINNIRFTMKSYTTPSIWPGYGINFCDMDLIADIEAKGFFVKGSKIGGTCTYLHAKEKSGYEINDLSAKVSAGYGKVLLNNLYFQDSWSNIKLKSYSMTNARPTDYTDFINKIVLEAHFDENHPSQFSLNTLHYFTKGFENSEFNFLINKGEFKGCISDFVVQDFDFKELSTGVKAQILCNISGLPDVNKMTVKANVNNIQLTKDYAGLSPKLQAIANVSANGQLNKLKADIDFTSKVGEAKLKANVNNLLDESKDLELLVSLLTNELNLSAFALDGLEDFGALTLATSFNGKLSNTDLKSFNLDSLHISNFIFKNLEYNNIGAKARYEDNSLWADVYSKDEKLKFQLRGESDNVKSLLSITKLDNVELKLNGNFENIDLDAMQLGINNENFSKLHFKLLCDIGLNSGILNGEALINNISITNQALEERELSDIVFKAYHDGQYHYELDSPMLELALQGDGTLIDFSSDIMALTAYEELNALIPASKKKEKEINDNYSLSLTTFDTRNYLDYIKPGLYIADGTKLRLDIENGKNLIASVLSERIAIGTTYIKDLDIQIDNFGESLNLVVFGSELMFGKFGINEPLISAYADDNHCNLSLSVAKLISEGSKANLFLDCYMHRDSTNTLLIDAHANNSSVYLDKNNKWSLDNCALSTRAGNFYVEDFRFANNNQEIYIDGTYSTTNTDTLSLGLRNIDLSLLDDLLPNKLNIKGYLNGEAIIASQKDLSPAMLSNLSISDLSLGDVDGGTIFISSESSDNSQAINFSLKQEIQKRNTLLANGTYRLKGSDFELITELNEYPLALSSSFLSQIMSQIDGSLSAKFALNRTSSRISASSQKISLRNSHIQLIPTGVTYLINGDMHLDNKGLYFDDFVIYDDDLGSATLSGAINHNRLKDFSLNTKVDLSNLKVIDLNKNNSSTLPLYGSTSLLGNVNLTGAFNTLNINANVSTVGNSEITIVATNGLIGKTSDLLSFTPIQLEVDPYEEMIEKMNQTQKKQNDLNVVAQVNIHSGLHTYLDMGGDDGNGAAVNGNGNVNIHIRPSRSVMDLNGAYNISEGTFRFVLPGVLNKKFDIQRGSNVSFGGNLLDTRLDITALYSLKTSLSTIILSEENKVANRHQVDCGINISDRLSNPTIDFSIDLPDVDATTKSEFNAIVSTSDKIQKQFLALLIMGSFIPDDNSGIVNSSSLLLSNATELMSNQLNSIFEKLNVPVDIGFGYQGTNTGSNIFDVAISTQLFNNRVIVGGSMGNRRYGNTTTSDIVGNLDIQIKLDSEGKYRLNLFSHSADAYSSYIDNSQRNGVGFSYLFSPKSKVEEKPPIVITIDKDE